MNLTEPRELASLLEAFLLASGKPQSLERLYELFEEGERPEPPVFKKALTLLGKSCEGRAPPAIACKSARSSRRGLVACGRSVRSAIPGHYWKPWR